MKTASPLNFYFARSIVAAAGVMFLSLGHIEARDSASDIIRQDDRDTSARLEAYLAEHPDAKDRSKALERLISIYGSAGKADDRNRVLEMKYKIAIDDPAFKELTTPLAIKDFF